jgi:signal transduction histidine kinase
VAADAALAIGVGAVTYVVYRDSWLAALAGSGISLGFAVLFGFWMFRIIGQSIDRRTVIAELEQTRQELAAVNHRAGVLAERERLAREIHDTLAQGFTSVVVLLELAESEVDTDPAAARQRLAIARETARQNLAEARALVAALTPVDLQTAPLPEAIGRLVDRFGAETGLPARLTVTGEPRALPANTEVVLLRAAQEALANVRKHAGAGQVEVTLDGAVLAVANDGAGFDPAAPTGGYGLAGMRRRVEEIGGTVSIASGPAGTRVEVRC